MTWQATVLLAAALLASASVSAQPSGLFGDSRPSFLDVDEAFRFHTSLDASDKVSVHWTIAPAYYLYRDKFSFELIAPDEGNLETTHTMPAGISHHDEFFGNVEVYYQDLSISIDLPVAARSDGYRLQIRYQGCAEAGLCYPPQTRLVEISP
ncbi:MAG: protein-disulfide reductase DsbD domain-containing protein [Pseudohongiella sp.]|uniref:protein-disulfide reductase DsbD domain-containing protein n=1 Tax=Pseudohongiella sp. TaxID=1979412 RepID=UPI0034A0A015